MCFVDDGWTRPQFNAWWEAICTVINQDMRALTKIPHEHVPKSHVITCDHTCNHMCSHVITCDFGTCSCGIFVRATTNGVIKHLNKSKNNFRFVLVKRELYDYYYYKIFFVLVFALAQLLRCNARTTTSQREDDNEFIIEDF